MFAAENGNLDIFKLLVDNGANIGDDDYGKTALMYAAGRGHPDIVRYLVDEKKVNVNQPDDDGKTPLMYAAESGNPEVFHYLIEKGVDISAASKKVGSVLPHAAAGDNPSILQYCLEKNPQADIDEAREYYNGRTALMLAAQSGNLEGVKLLVGKGAKINKIDNNGAPH